MSRILENFRLAVEGFGRFIAEYKLLAAAAGVLLYLLSTWKNRKNKNERYLTLYTLIMTIAATVPFTAALLLFYQTGFYDYEWLWSMVPLTAVVSWGMTEIILEKVPQKGYIAGILTAAAILFLCGNQGRLQTVSEEEQALRQDAEVILEYLENEGRSTDSILWGPQMIMEQVRLNSGAIQLYYGRDMWDAKAGAYDYEPYSEEEIRSYEWMELLSASRSLYLLEVNQATVEIYGALAETAWLQAAVESGVNVIVLPQQITEWMERKIDVIAAENGLSVKAVQIKEHTLWMLDLEDADE